VASWETIVNDVVIGSNFYALQDASDQYQRLMSALYQLHDSLQSLTENSEGWTGAAADAFRGQVKTMATNTNDLVESHNKIPQGLGACATALQTAVSSIPIPDWMYQDVSQRQAAYQNRGPLVEAYKPGSIMNTLTGIVGRVDASIPLTGEQYKEAEGWVNGNESKAQAAYQALQNAYGNEYPNIPAGSPIPGAGTNGLGAGMGAIGSGLQAVGAMLGPHGGAGGVNPSGLGPGGFNPSGTGSLNSGGPDMGGSGSFHDPGIGTTLAGVDPSMLSPSGGGGGFGSPGFGTGTFGSGGGPGLAGSGSGGFGGLSRAGRGLPALGPSVSGPSGAMGLAGMGGMGAMGGGAGGARTRSGSSIPSGRGTGAGVMGGGLGAGGRGAAGARGGAGVVGGGLGSGVDGEDDDRLTWLQEDDDVWGTNNTAPPGVLS
jgi:uncharacterized protein YukE